MMKSLFPLASPELRERLDRHETLRLIDGFAWEKTALGAMAEWPQSLKSAIRVLMLSETPMVAMVGHDGILIYNDGYAAFAGRRHPEIFGMKVTEAWPEIADFNTHKLDLGFAGKTLILRDQELLLDRHGQPETSWMDLHYSPLPGDDGEPQGVLVIVHETTDRILADGALARSEERLSLALSGSALVGTWDWDIVNDSVTADDRFAELFALDSLRAGLGLPIASFTAAIHPDDQERVGREIADSVATGENYRSEYRVTNRDGVVHWVVASGRPRQNAEGISVRFPGIVVDVTEQKAVAEALAESELRFRTLADTMPQMVWSTQPDGFHDYYNARWYAFTGVPAGSTDGEGWNGMFHPDDQDRAWAAWRHSLNTGEPYDIEYRLRHHTGQYRWTLGRALPIRDADGQIVRWFGTCTDIDDTKIAAEERELVAQELSHRIKNIFAVLNGIIGLASRGRPEVKQFADDLRQRLHSLGEAHDFVRPHSPLSGPPTNQTSLNALTRRLLRAYEQDGSSRIQFAGDDAEIDDGAATPLALLIHELATNSAKYGALSVAGGQVNVSGQIAEDTYVLTWKESGGPAIADTERRQGFGSRLISLSVEGQMRGKLERHWDADGLRLDVQLPVSALRRSAKLGTGA